MSNLSGKPGELRATVSVTRAATGKTETYELIGHGDPAVLAQLVAAHERGLVHGAAGALVGEGSSINDNPPE